MKVIEGDFGKEKQGISKLEQVEKLLKLVKDDIQPEGEYDEIVVILNRSDGGGSTFATNQSPVDMNYLLDFMKYVIMTSGFDPNEDEDED